MIKTLNNREIKLLLGTNYIGNLAYIYNNKPFVVPITYFYDEESNQIIGYSGEGHKISAMRKNSSVSLSVSGVASVDDWKSVLVQGTYIEQAGPIAKAFLHKFSLGVKDLILRKELRELDFINEFSSKDYTDEIPIVFTISVTEITGRMRTSL